jgi:hypothetical protein
MHTAQIALPSIDPHSSLPLLLQAIPSMMSQRERRLLLSLAELEYRGHGVIFDAGVFCGSSTLCFGTGIALSERRNAIMKRWKRPIRTYEFGTINPNMVRFFERNGVEGNWKAGESFADFLRANIAPVSDKVELNVGDICNARWGGEPIEIMFLDVLKSEQIQLKILREFMPALIENGFLIQQDYFYDGLPFVKIVQEHFADHFEFLGEVQSSALFRLVRPITAEQAEQDPVATLPLARQLELLDQARDRSVDPARHLMCDFGKVRFLAERGEVELARTEMAQVEARYADLLREDGWPRLLASQRVATNRIRLAERTAKAAA